MDPTFSCCSCGHPVASREAPGMKDSKAWMGSAYNGLKTHCALGPGSCHFLKITLPLKEPCWKGRACQTALCGNAGKLGHLSLSRVTWEQYTQGQKPGLWRLPDLGSAPVPHRISSVTSGKPPDCSVPISSSVEQGQRQYLHLLHYGVVRIVTSLR